ncbi:MAG: glycoside hydrolase family 140 protein [Anaerolineae bacterium]|nr:glycoside hydrolase family 140 protein [Anaerolineae bacterium]
MTASGAPFFWLGDTAWELFHRLSREEAELYLDNRAAKGFNVIQAVILAERDGLHTPNVYGQLPLYDDDPTRLREDYFEYVDTIIRLAESKGLYIGLLPTWGDKVDLVGGMGPIIFDVENAAVYGKLLGTRYREQSNIVWILGGDRFPDGFEAIWRSMAQGILEGTRGRALITYHPRGAGQSSSRLHEESWLSLNMIQSGHGTYDVANWELVLEDFGRVPAKPTLDSEPNYEFHPVGFDAQLRSGRFSDFDVRKAAYRAVLSGACGHTYGHHSIWQMYDERYEPVLVPGMTWREALDAPGAYQMQYLRHLFESRPFFSRMPDSNLVANTTQTPPSQVCASRDAEGAYAMIYLPTAGQSVDVNLDRLSGSQFNAWWYDPRTGQSSAIGMFEPSPMQTFVSPQDGPDWVLVIDDAKRGFLPPGQ